MSPPESKCSVGSRTASLDCNGRAQAAICRLERLKEAALAGEHTENAEVDSEAGAAVDIFDRRSAGDCK
jgi:hypothetical protein